MNNKFIELSTLNVTEKAFGREFNQAELERIYRVIDSSFESKINKNLISGEVTRNKMSATNAIYKGLSNYFKEHVRATETRIVSVKITHATLDSNIKIVFDFIPNYYVSIQLPVFAENYEAFNTIPYTIHNSETNVKVSKSCDNMFKIMLDAAVNHIVSTIITPYIRDALEALTKYKNDESKFPFIK